MSQLPDLDWGLAQLASRRPAYQLAHDYYDGKHRLAFASDKFRSAFGALFQAFADNLCPAVIDATVDRLVITGFQPTTQAEPDSRVPALVAVPPAPTGDGAAPAPPRAPDPPARAWQIWQANHMDRQAGAVHLEACLAGDSYLIVWPAAGGGVRLDPQAAHQAAVQYDPERPEITRCAAKIWPQGDGTVRATLYYADRIEKYITARSTRGMLPADGRGFVRYTPPGEAWPLRNIWDTVPVFHFASNPRLGAPDRIGRSDLTNVIPLQDALNKAVCDMLVGMEFNAFPQRWVTGLEVELDEVSGRPIAPFVPGEDRIWAVGDKDIHFGEFPAASLKNYLEVQDSMRAEIARVSGTPVHYLMLLAGRWPSGEALRIAEVRLVHKIQDRALGFGETWGAAISLALRMQGVSAGVMPAWQDPAPHSQLEQAQQLSLQQTLGVPRPVLWAALGYTEVEIAQMLTAAPPPVAGNGAPPPGLPLMHGLGR